MKILISHDEPKVRFAQRFAIKDYAGLRVCGDDRDERKLLKKLEDGV